MLEFYDQNLNEGVASIYERHISFNAKMIKYFETCYKVRVGLDKEEGKVFIFICDRDYALSGEISESSLLSIQVSKSYVRISSKQLVDYIKQKFDLDIPKKGFVQFKASYDTLKKCVIINIGGKER